MKLSAGILLYRGHGKATEVLLVHPGGPFWAKKDAGAWSLPKGEVIDGEEPQLAAKREFAEELGLPLPEGALEELGSNKVSSGKTVIAWSLAADLDVSVINSQTFEMVWPPKSGQTQQFPEVDRAAWFTVSEAVVKLSPGQVVFVERLAARRGAAVQTKAVKPPKPEQTSLF
jgi:predicted NUDIX family NTP pyrophosphohydrolase